MEGGNENHEFGTGFFVHKRIIISWYSSLARGCRWCDTVLNVHDPTEDKIVNMKESFYEEL
jgi:hypothetical protein